MTDRFMKIVKAQFKKTWKEDHPNMLFYLDESNNHVMYMLVVGLPYPYLEGEFIFKLTLDDKFPKTPPKVRCMTPNGVYMENGSICISIGEFHANDHRASGASASSGDWGWSPQLGVFGFAREVLNGLIDPSILTGNGRGGIGLINTPTEERAKLSAASMDYNLTHNGELRALIYEHSLTMPHLAASAQWGAQIGVREVRTSPPGGVRREVVAAAFGEEISALVPEPKLETARALCEIDPQYRRAVALCTLCPISELAHHAAANVAFLGDQQDALACALASPPADGDAESLRKQIILAIVCNMRQNFAERDALMCNIVKRN